MGVVSAPALPKLAASKVAPGSFFSQHEIEAAKMCRYAAAMKVGEVFPPVVVVRYGEKVMPLDGHHRLAAAAATDTTLDAIECDGGQFEDFCIAVGSAEGDRLVLATAAEMLAKARGE